MRYVLITGGGLNAGFEALPASQTALGRVGEPGEAARVIASLPTAAGDGINARTIEVSGGHII